MFKTVKAQYETSVTQSGEVLGTTTEKSSASVWYIGLGVIIVSVVLFLVFRIRKNG